MFKYYTINQINLPPFMAVSNKTICRKSTRNKMPKDDIVSSVKRPPKYLPNLRLDFRIHLDAENIKMTR